MAGTGVRPMEACDLRGEAWCLKKEELFVNNDGLHSMTVRKIGEIGMVLHPEKKSLEKTFPIPAIFSTAQNMGSEFYCRSSISTSQAWCVFQDQRYVLGHNVSFQTGIADEVLVDDKAVRPDEALP